MKSNIGIRLLIAAAALLTSMLSTYAVTTLPQGSLASPDSFAAIQDNEARSAALFGELSKVFTHPRCANCHPAGDRPRQGDMRRLHQPPVERGKDGHGLASMRCNTCHKDTNFDPGRVPGDPAWHLAPLEMGWEGKTPGEICAQIKDPARNGGRSLDEIVTHIGTDHLVAWAWAPGAGRQPAPGTQQGAEALAAAWVKTGAACPKK